MKVSNEILDKINFENLKDQMIESCRMGSGLKDEVIHRLFSGQDVFIPRELEKYLNSQMSNWFQQNLNRKKKSKHVA